MARWLLQCSPAVWDVFEWWEEGDGDLDDWTVARHLDEMARGDDFAFWIGGKEAGVYAVGKLASSPYPVDRPSGGHWRKEPAGPVHAVDLRTTRYLFDSPIRKGDLVLDPDFRDALIIRMPRTANPIELHDSEWQAIRRRIGTSAGRRGRPSYDAGEVVVTERPLGAVQERVSVAPPVSSGLREHREALMLKRYERFLKRDLVVRSARMPDGDRLVADAYDATADRLIEAKSSASRQDVRMAIGQLFDYRRHLCPKAAMAMLLPAAPSPDLLDLLKSLKIAVIVEVKRGKFREV